MFSKAKLKRFNEEASCAPPPTAYDPKFKSGRPSAVTLEKSDRWKAQKEVTPGPGAYTGQLVTSPTKPLSSTSSKLNSSNCSSTSTTSSCGVFVSPKKPPSLSRSQSMKIIHKQANNKDSRINELEKQIGELPEERDSLKQLITQLEKQLEELQKKVNRGDRDQDIQNTERVKYEAELSSARFTLDDNEAQMESLNATISLLTQQNEQLRMQIDSGGKTNETDLHMQLEASRNALTDAQQHISVLIDERSGVTLKLKKLEESEKQKSLSEDELPGLKERLDHLTLLRDNLESSVRSKDDLIAELQVQLDEMVVEGRSFHEQMVFYKSRMEQLEVEIENSFLERDDTDNKVRNLVAKYESLMKDQMEEREINREILAKKDIEIELLNASLSNLNMKASEYEQTIISLEEERHERLSKISVLETTISELSMKTKENEMMESILDEELNHRTDEVKLLEEKVKAFEIKLDEVRKEKDIVAAKLEIESKVAKELNQRISVLEMEIKEKEVVQQFLEKEITAREGEVSESASKMKTLEEDLDRARQVALDLQQDAEVKLNEVLHLKSTISYKDTDCKVKEELLTTLKEELHLKMDETSVLQDQVQSCLESRRIMEEELTHNEEKINILDEELTTVKAALKLKEESIAFVEKKIAQLQANNDQLEEKVVELMGEISDREAEHIVRLKTVESDLEDIGVKYSDSLLEHEATRRVLSQTLEQLEKEKLLLMASEGDLGSLKEEFSKYREEKEAMQRNLKDLVQKYTSLEDALACEEAENRDLEERLEHERKLAKEAAAAAEKEIASLKTSSDGFCTQITQLKIDMRKKSQAVEEMQQCIEALREEKSHLVTLRDNLEKTVESKEESIAKLHLQISTIEREMEEERVTLRSRIADLENHLKEANDEQVNNSKKIRDMKEKLSTLEEENLHLNKSFEKQLEEKTVFETEANNKLEELKRQYDGYEDQLKNLQTSLIEKTQEVEAVREKYGSVDKTMESQKEEMKVLETNIKRFKREIEAMNKSLASKDSTLDSLNSTLGAKSEEVQSLYKKLEEKQSALLACECKVQQLEEIEEKLMKEKECLELSMSTLQHDLSTTKSQYSRLESTFSEEKNTEKSRVTLALEVDIKEQKELSKTLQEELDSWKSKFQQLEKMVEPFREQLDAYEVEKENLLSRNSAAQEEVDKLSKQYATLLGHQNHKQKIHYVVKLKKENNELREDAYKSRRKIELQRKTIKRLEERMCRISESTSRLDVTGRSAYDKENSVVGGITNQSLISTPLKSSNKPHRI